MNKKLQRRLHSWQQAGLIDESTAVRIAAFEAQRRGPNALMVMAVLGGTTVGLGIISIVAANWEAIGGRVKIGIDLGLVLAVSVALFRSVRAQQPVLRETLVAIDYLLVLASLALVGQVYQLGTPTYQALIGWTLATGPLLLLARSVPLAYLWLAGIATTYAVSLEPLLDAIDSLGVGFATGLVLAVALFGAPLLLRVGSRLFDRSPTYRSQRQAFADASRWTTHVGAFVSTFAWYNSVRDYDLDETWGVIAGATVVTAIAWSCARWLWPNSASRPTAPLWFVFAWAQLVLGASFERDSWPVIGALMQIALLIAWATLAHRRHASREFGTLTALIGLRVLIVYFEVFGSLLDTGIGLITGGALTLGLVYGWQRMTKKNPSSSSDMR